MMWGLIKLPFVVALAILKLPFVFFMEFGDD